MSEDCHECSYLRAERAGIHMTHAGLDREKADALAASERCAEHLEGLKVESGGVERKELKITVIQHERNAKQEGEFVGWPRTLAGPFRLGFDGRREEVLGKYKVWLFGQVKGKAHGFRKMVELMPLAKRDEGLTLVCLEPGIGEIIASCMKWMDRQVLS